MFLPHQVAQLEFRAVLVALKMGGVGPTLARSFDPRDLRFNARAPANRRLRPCKPLGWKIRNSGVNTLGCAMGTAPIKNDLPVKFQETKLLRGKDSTSK